MLIALVYLSKAVYASCPCCLYMLSTQSFVPMQSKRAWVPHAGTIVEGLVCLMPYGLPAHVELPSARPTAGSANEGPTPSNPAADQAAPSPSGSAKVRYLPPHLRASAAAASTAPSIAPTISVTPVGRGDTSPASSGRTSTSARGAGNARRSNQGSDGEDAAEGSSSAAVDR